MGYYFNEFFKDKKYWLNIILYVLGILVFYDISFFVFQGYVAKYCLILAVIIFLIAVSILAKQEITRRKIKKDLPIFESARKIFLKEQLQANQNFQTHCFDCCHFDEEFLCCNLHLPGRNMKIRFSAEDLKEFCLYWNVVTPVHLLENHL